VEQELRSASDAHRPTSTLWGVWQSVNSMSLDRMYWVLDGHALGSMAHVIWPFWGLRQPPKRGVLMGSSYPEGRIRLTGVSSGVGLLIVFCASDSVKRIWNAVMLVMEYIPFACDFAIVDL